MKTIACLVLALALGCQQGDRATPSPTATAPAAAPSSDYARDIEALCEVATRSGADATDARTLTIANWLAANLKTPESRTFLVKIQPLGGEAKAQALETEAKRVGLAGCALAAEWRTPTP